MKLIIVRKPTNFSIPISVTFWKSPNILFIMSWRTRINENNSTNRKSFKIKVNIFVQQKRKIKKNTKTANKNYFSMPKVHWNFPHPIIPSHSVMLSHFDLYRKYNCICVEEISRLQLHIYVYFKIYVSMWSEWGKKFEGLDDN